jgi:hypothetical protein
MARLLPPADPDLPRRLEAARALVSNASMPTLPRSHELHLNTHADCRIEHEKKAGVDTGRIHNAWVDCTFLIIPSTKGTRFTATFATKDDGKIHSVTGVAPDRKTASALVLQGLTARIALEVETRKAWMRRWNHAQQLSLRDGIPLAAPPRKLRLDCPACGHDITEGRCGDLDCECATCILVNEIAP